MAVEPNIILGIAGVLFGAGGLLIGVYSYLRQQKFEGQLERKEELREVADLLGKLEHLLSGIHTYALNPREHEDMALELRKLGLNVLSYWHQRNRSPRVEIISINSGGLNNGKVLSNTDEVMTDIKNSNDSILMRLRVGDETDKGLGLDQSYLIWDTISLANFTYEFINNTDEREKDLIQEFDQHLLDDIENTLDKFLINLFNHIYDNAGGDVFNPDDFESPREISDAIYEFFIFYEEIQNDLEAINKLSERVGKLRTGMVQTSFS